MGSTPPDTWDVPTLEASQAFAEMAIAPAAIGWTLCIFMYGFVLRDFMGYCGTAQWKKDSRGLKFLTMAVMLLATAQAGNNYYLIFHYLTAQNRTVDDLVGQTVGDCLFTFWVGWEGALVQAYLGKRASGIFERRWQRAVFMTVLGLGIVGSLVGSMGYIGVSFAYRAGIYGTFDFGVSVGIWGVCAAFVDILISCTLAVLLWPKIAGLNPSVDAKLKTVVQVGFECASYTAVLATVSAITSFAFQFDTETQYSPGFNSDIAFFAPLSSLYAYSLLVILRSRDRAKNAASKTSVVGPMADWVSHEPQSDDPVSPKRRIVPSWDPEMSLGAMLDMNEEKMRSTV